MFDFLEIEIINLYLEEKIFDREALMLKIKEAGENSVEEDLKKASISVVEKISKLSNQEFQKLIDDYPLDVLF